MSQHYHLFCIQKVFYIQGIHRIWFKAFEKIKQKKNFCFCFVRFQNVIRFNICFPTLQMFNGIENLIEIHLILMFTDIYATPRHQQLRSIFMFSLLSLSLCQRKNKLPQW